MNRRAFLAGMAASLMATPALSKARRPNILVVVCDDLNDFPVPNLSRLAAAGHNYVNAHCSAPACSPSRAAFLYGVNPWESGVYTLDEHAHRNTLLSRRQSLPEAMRAQGYATFGAGKVFHGDSNRPAWDEYKSAGETIWGDHVACGVEYGTEVDIEQMSDYRLTRWMTESVLKKRHRKPFFAMIGLVKPHTPLVVPPQFRAPAMPVAGIQDDDLDDLGPYARRMTRQISSAACRDDRAPVVLHYQAAARFADHCIGRLVEAAPANTLVVVTSDHGFQLGEKGAWHKFTRWERSTKVPLVVAADWLPARTIARPASLVDLFSMLVEGRSEMPPREAAITSWLLKGEQRPSFSARTRHHRLIRYRTGETELYRHPQDRYELRNLAPKEGALVERLARLLPEHWVPRNG